MGSEVACLHPFSEFGTEALTIGPNDSFHFIKYEDLSMSSKSIGLISVEEAYSKQMVLERLNISQKFWDQMLAAGLPFTAVGHSRWVTGADLIDFLKRHSIRKEVEAI